MKSFAAAKVKSVVAFTILILASVIGPAVLVEARDDKSGRIGEAPGTPRAEAVTSFQTLPLVLKVGDEVNVKDESGRATRGKVVCISNDQLVVAPERFLFHAPSKRTFLKDAVQRIDVVDPTWDGELKGAAAVIGVWAAVTAIHCSHANYCNGNFGPVGSWLVGSVLFAPIGAGIGGVIDWFVNKTIYERKAGQPAVTFSPQFGRDRIGVVAGVYF